MEGVAIHVKHDYDVVRVSNGAFATLVVIGYAFVYADETKYGYDITVLT